MTTAIEAGATPDFISEGPERLSDLWTDQALVDIGITSLVVVAACLGADCKNHEYLLCMTTHCMANNDNAFEAADTLQYIDEETHTWTAEGFENALCVLSAACFNPTGVVYSGG